MLKKIAILFLSCTIIVSALGANLSASAEPGALPDASILVEKEFTKAVNLSDFVVAGYYHDGAFDTTATPETLAAFYKTDATLGSEYIHNGEAWTAENSYILYYPLTSTQTLKKFSYSLRNMNESYCAVAPYFTDSEHDDSLVQMTLSVSGTGETYSVKWQPTFSTDEISNISSFGGGNALFSGKVGSWTAKAPQEFDMSTVTTVLGSTGKEVTAIGKTAFYDYNVDYGNGSIDFTMTNAQNASTTVNFAASATKKQYPMLRSYQKYNATNFMHYKDMEITYTDSVDIIDEVRTFVEANPLALELRNNTFDYSNISNEDVAAAQAMQTAYEGANANLQIGLSSYGYYNAAKVSSIIDGTAVVDYITSSVYSANNKYISDIPAETGISDFLANIDNNQCIQILDENSLQITEGNIKTGMFVCAVVNGETVASLTAVVNGDINCDGNFDVRDLVRLKKAIVSSGSLSEAQCFAAAGEAKAEVSADELVSVKKALLML